MKRITVIDNYDSFVFNLVRYLKESGCEVDVQRNDQLNFAEIGQSDGILISPGPGIPSEAGQLMEAISLFSGTKNILGVCLGHQALAESFGGSIEQSQKAVHGKASTTYERESSTLFSNLPSSFEVGRYHSWQVQKAPLEFRVTRETSQGEIMAMEHKELPIYGVQFHPESILTPNGRAIINNWINTLK
ncbi:MAG: anthranilate synthase component 2 [Crocinitomicaceae bacterium]|jgi:anthranilate synthase component 2